MNSPFLAGLLLLMASSAQADPLDLCFDGANGVAVLRQANLLADLVDKLEAQFGGVPAVDIDIDAWRTLEISGVWPAARNWGPKLHPERGVALCVNQKRIRFIIGADSVRSVITLVKRLPQETFKATGASGFSFKDQNFKCDARNSFVVCDSQDPKGQHPLPWLKSSPVATNGLFFMGAQLPNMPVQAAYLAIQNNAHGAQLTGRIQLAPQVASMAAQFVGSDGQGVLGQYVDRESGTAFKISVNGPTIVGMALKKAARSARPLLKALQKAWTGEILLTADGGFAHPVALLSVKSKGAAVKAVRMLAKTFKATDIQVSVINLPTRKGMKALRFEKDPVRVDLPFATLPDALIFALAPEDIERRISGRVKALPMADLNQRGVQGMVLTNPGALLDLPWAREIFEMPFGGPSPLMSMVTAFVSRIELRISLSDTTAKIDGQLRFLPRSGPGRSEYIDAIRMLMKGDALQSNSMLLQIAAKYVDSPFGQQARGRLMSSAAVVPMVGILAAIAIPAFMKYTRRSKTAEATMNIRALFDSSVAYYESEFADKTGKILPHRFPPSAPLTPPKSACESGGEKFKPKKGTWSHPTWRALNFAIQSPHRYQYEYISDGKSFTARAIGDLDCDGIFSTFERVGTVDRNGNINGGAGLYKSNELE